MGAIGLFVLARSPSTHSLCSLRRGAGGRRRNPKKACHDVTEKIRNAATTARLSEHTMAYRYLNLIHVTVGLANRSLEITVYGVRTTPYSAIAKVYFHAVRVETSI